MFHNSICLGLDRYGFLNGFLGVWSNNVRDGREKTMLNANNKKQQSIVQIEKEIGLYTFKKKASDIFCWGLHIWTNFHMFHELSW